MSPQREGESQEMYMYRLEMTQERHEDEIGRINSRVDSVEAVAIEAREIAMQTNSMVEAMPQRVIAELRKQNDRGLSWVVGIASILGTCAAVLIAILK